MLFKNLKILEKHFKFVDFKIGSTGTLKISLSCLSGTVIMLNSALITSFQLALVNYPIYPYSLY